MAVLIGGVRTGWSNRDREAAQVRLGVRVGARLAVTRTRPHGRCTSPPRPTAAHRHSARLD